MPDSLHKITLPSPLFPFRATELPLFQYGLFTLRNVFEQISDSEREACVQMWLQNGVVPTEDAAWQRSEEVCYFITQTATDKLVGVNTLYKGQVVPGGPEMFLNRMFIDPKFRSSRLMITGTGMMLCYAKLHLSDRGVRGVANINENRKLAREGARRIFKRLGYQSKGFLNGQEVLRFDFDRIDIEITNA